MLQVQEIFHTISTLESTGLPMGVHLIQAIRAGMQMLKPVGHHGRGGDLGCIVGVRKVDCHHGRGVICAMQCSGKPSL